MASRYGILLAVPLSPFLAGQTCELGLDLKSKLGFEGLLTCRLVTNRFPRQRDPRSSSSLFDSYGGGDSRPASRSPAPAGGYGYGGYAGPAVNAYPNGNGNGSASFRSATPDKKYVITFLSRIQGVREEGLVMRTCLLSWAGSGLGLDIILIFVLGVTIPMLCFLRLNLRMMLRLRVSQLK